MSLEELALLDTLGFGRSDVAETRLDGVASIVFGHAAGHVFGDAHLRVEAQLLVHVLGDVVAPEAEVAAPGRCLLHAGLARGASSAAKTACANRVHVALSCRNCARPFAE